PRLLRLLPWPVAREFWPIQIRVPAAVSTIPPLPATSRRRGWVCAKRRRQCRGPVRPDVGPAAHPRLSAMSGRGVPAPFAGGWFWDVLKPSRHIGLMTAKIQLFSAPKKRARREALFSSSAVHILLVLLARTPAWN